MTVPDGHKEAQPINERTVDGTTYRYKYTFNSVAVDAIEEDMAPDNVDIDHQGDYVRWQYGDRFPVFIHREKVTYPEENREKKADNQAYFALSILADAGVVSGFQQRG